MTSKSIIIIGAGMAGLSTGCYAQMNGYKSEIFELHNLPGGLCTAWKRKGFVFDGCIHWLVGTGKNTPFNRLWMEVGALQDKQIVDHDEFVRYVGKNGKTLILYTDIDKFEQHLLDLAPMDNEKIRSLTKDMRKLAGFGGFIGMPEGIKGFLQLVFSLPTVLPAINAMKKYSSITVLEFANSFKDPFLREAFSAFFQIPEMSAAAMIMSLIWMGQKDAGYPIGGSLPFSQSIEKRYIELGGQVHYHSPVEKILVEAGKATGVRLANGTEHHADIVVSAADGHATLYKMLEGKFLTDEFRNYYDTFPIFEPIIQVSMGINADLSNEPHMATYFLEEAVEIAGEIRNTVSIKHYCYDPTIAPQGKSVVVVSYNSNHAYWKKIHDEDTEHYEAEKKDIAIKTINLLEKRIPGISNKIEVTDVATPLTFERYTGNWQGSFEGWLITPQTMKMTMSGKGMSKTLLNLENFYMAGQWVEPGGGLPTGLLSGRNIIKTICKKDGKRFISNTP